MRKQMRQTRLFPLMQQETRIRISHIALYRRFSRANDFSGRSDCFASSSRLAHYEILAFPRDKISSLVKRLYLFTHTDSRQIAIYSPINRELLFSHLTIMQNIIINIIPNCIGFVHK